MSIKKERGLFPIGRSHVLFGAKSAPEIVPPAKQSAQRQEQGGEDTQRFQRHGPGLSEEVDGHCVLQAQIHAVGAEGGQLGQQGDGNTPAVPHRPDQGDHIGQEKIALVHIGEKKGDPQGQNGGSRQKLCTGEAAAVEKEPSQHKETQGKGGQNPGPGQGLLRHIHPVGDQGEEGRGVEHQSIAVLSRLL